MPTSNACKNYLLKGWFLPFFPIFPPNVAPSSAQPHGWFETTDSERWRSGRGFSDLGSSLTLEGRSGPDAQSDRCYWPCIHSLLFFLFVQVCFSTVRSLCVFVCWPAHLSERRALRPAYSLRSRGNVHFLHRRPAMTQSWESKAKPILRAGASAAESVTSQTLDFLIFQ